jgi:hypothetical protein
VNDYERDPYKTVILSGIAVVSMEMLIRFDHVASGILLGFPYPWGHVLLLGIAVNCLVSLYGIVKQRTVRGVLWERVGQLGLAGHFFIYSVWGFSLFGEKATGFAGILLMLALAAILRVVQIERRRRKAVSRGTS